ncbi:hypothetical protein ACWGLG_16685 [Streptomyces antimycoticus]
MRTLTNPDGDWPYGCEVIDTGTCRTSAGLAARLGIRVGATARRETLECWDPGGRSAMLVTTWWHGRRRKHVSAVFEVGTVRLDARQAQAFRLPMDTVALLVQRTRLGAGGLPVEVADLVLPTDRWQLRM